MADFEQRKIRYRAFTRPNPLRRKSPAAYGSLDDSQFSAWFCLMVRAVSHEVSNSVLALHRLSLKKGIRDDPAVSGLIDEFNFIRSLSEYSRESPSETISKNLAAHFSDVPPEELANHASRVRHIRIRALESVHQFRAYLVEAAGTRLHEPDQDNDSKFHLVRALRYGSTLCDYLERLMGGEFGREDFATPCKITGFRSLVDECRTVASESGCGFGVSAVLPDAAASLAMAEPFLFRLIALNVISNAIRACRAAGKEPQIFLSVECLKEGHISFRFRDYGAGMEEPVMNRLNSGAMVTTKEDGGQHGIGFLYSADIASRMGGRLYVETSAPGRGTLIVLELRECVIQSERLH